MQNLIKLGERSKSDITKRKKKGKRALVLRDAPHKPTAGRDGSEAVLSMEVWVWISCSPLVCIEVEEKWRSGASSCHEAPHAQHGLPIVLVGMQIKLIDARASKGIASVRLAVMPT